MYLGCDKLRHTTRGHKTLGAKWLFEPQFSHQSSLYLDSEVLRIPQRFYTAIRWRRIRFALLLQRFRAKFKSCEATHPNPH